MTLDRRYRHALVLLDDGHPDEAIAILSDLVEHHRKGVLAVRSRVTLGELMTARGRYDEARRLMTDAIIAADRLGGTALDAELDTAMDVLADLP